MTHRISVSPIHFFQINKLKIHHPVTHALISSPYPLPPLIQLHPSAYLPFLQAIAPGFSSCRQRVRWFSRALGAIPTGPLSSNQTPSLQLANCLSHRPAALRQKQKVIHISDIKQSSLSRSKLPSTCHKKDALRSVLKAQPRGIPDRGCKIPRHPQCCNQCIDASPVSDAVPL